MKTITEEDINYLDKFLIVICILKTKIKISGEISINTNI